MRICAVEVLCSPSSVCSVRDMFVQHFGFVLSRESKDYVVLLSSPLSVILLSEEDRQGVHQDTVSNIIIHAECVQDLHSRVLLEGVHGELEEFDCPCGRSCVLVIDTPFKSVQHSFTTCLSYAQHRFCSHNNQQSVQLALSKIDAWKDCLYKDISKVDHVTFGCHEGQSKDLVGWYERVLHFQRLPINSQEDEDGFRIDCDYNGMKLMAMEYFKCSEVGVTTKNASKSREKDFKIVFAEPLPGIGTNQISVFLKENGGAGVQHIAFLTTSMVSTVGVLKDHGVCFIQPPPEYYTEVGRLAEIREIGLSAQDLERHGILLDAEHVNHDITAEEDRSHISKQYLLQVFTETLFSARTFFFEYIQRNGAKGFGSGNIIALWKALQTHMSDSIS